MEAFIQELGGGVARSICALPFVEGAAVSRYPWKSALLAWHPKDVPNFLSRGPPHLASQAAECKPSWDLKKGEHSFQKSGGA